MGPQDPPHPTLSSSQHLGPQQAPPRPPLWAQTPLHLLTSSPGQPDPNTGHNAGVPIVSSTGDPAPRRGGACHSTLHTPDLAQRPRSRARLEGRRGPEPSADEPAWTALTSTFYTLCVHVGTATHVHTHLHTQYRCAQWVGTHAQVCLHVGTCTRAHSCKCMHVCVHRYMCGQVCAQACTMHMCTHMHTYVARLQVVKHRHHHLNQHKEPKTNKALKGSRAFAPK